MHLSLNTNGALPTLLCLLARKAEPRVELDFEGLDPVLERSLCFRRCLTALTAFFTLLAPSVVSSQHVTARIIDDVTGGPLPHAVLTLLDTTGTAVHVVSANVSGQVLLKASRSGRYRVMAKHLSYAEVVSRHVELGDGWQVDLEIRMVPKPLGIKGMVVIAEPKLSKLEDVGFYRRRRNALGYFFDASEIQERHAQAVSDLLRLNPATQGLISRRTGCRLRFVLDGNAIAFDGVDQFVNTADLIGVEIYPGSGGVGAPVQYRGPEAFCGLVMVWTR